MKKRIASLLLALLLLTLPLLGMTSCDEVSGDTVTLYVYNWGEYISDGSDDSLDVNAAFEEATGITVDKVIVKIDDIKE